MLKLIRWVYSTSLLHCPTLKPHSDWTWQLSLFLCISHTARLFASFSIQYASLAWMVHEQYCQSLEHNRNSSTNRRKWEILSIYSFISYCLAPSLPESVCRDFSLSYFSPSLSSSVSLFLNVRLVLENRSEVVMRFLAGLGSSWIKSTLW